MSIVKKYALNDSKNINTLHSLDMPYQSKHKTLFIINSRQNKESVLLFSRSNSNENINNPNADQCENDFILFEILIKL